MSSSEKQQEGRRQELKLTARERLDTEEAERIRLLLGQIRDSWNELQTIFPDWARKTALAFSEIHGTKGLVAQLDHHSEYGKYDEYMALIEKLAKEGAWR